MPSPATRARRQVVLAGIASVAVAVAGLAACSSAKAPTTTTSARAVATTAPPTTAKAVSALAVEGVSPGVEQPAFYPQITVMSVVCGTTGGARYVALALPPGGAGTPAGTVFTEPTVALIVPGKAVIKDFATKVIFEEDMANITTARQGTFVLSLTNTTSRSGDGKPVPDGAMNISGDYTCPPTDVPLSGQ